MSPAAVAWTLAAILPFAFLLGSVPFGLVVGRMRGVDVRASGSGNIGATNVGRALGKRYFFVVLLLDALKAAIPAAIASVIVLTQLDPPQRSAGIFGLWIGTGVAALLGHVFSPFLGFKGGKGVACGLGLVLGVFPFLTLPGVIGLALFIGIFKATRYVSLGSIVAAASLPVSYLIFAMLLGWDLSRQWPILVLLVLVATLVVVRHRANISRLLAGTESKT